MRGWSPYFEQLIGAYSALDEHERALGAARQYRKTYGDDLATLRYEAAALAALGRVAEVNALLDDLTALPEDALSQGDVILGIALDQRRLGYSDAAQATVNRALGWYDAMEPEAKSSAWWRWSYAWALWGADRCDEGYNVAKSLAEEFPEEIEYGGLSGGLAACRGDLEEAQRMSHLLETLEGPQLSGEHTLWRSVIAAAQGDGESAVALIRQAVAQGIMHPVTWTLGWIAFEPIRDYPPWQEFIRPKG
jgi:hypothetical protein